MRQMKAGNDAITLARHPVSRGGYRRETTPFKMASPLTAGSYSFAYTLYQAFSGTEPPFLLPGSQTGRAYPAVNQSSSKTPACRG